MKISLVQPLPHQRAIELSVGLLLSGSALLMSVLPMRWLPHCGFAAWAHLPCPSCGTSRSLHLAMEGDWFNAFMMQPLFFTFSGIFAVWLLYALLAAFFKWPSIRIQLESKAEILGALFWAAVLIAANWSYLLFTQ